MKKLLSLAFMAIVYHTHAQDYLGLSTGNYSGITGVALQPANIADNRYQFDINLISASVNFDNNYLGFSRNYFLNNRFSFKDFTSYEDFKKKVLIENPVKGNNVYFNINNRIQLPISFLLTTGPKSGIAFSIQSRTSIALRNMNPDFAKQLFEFWKYQPTQGQFYDVSGMQLNALNWMEAGLSYGRVLMDEDKHFLKFGITAKYLGGISSWNMNAKDLRIKADKDSFMTAYGNDIQYSRSKSDISANINSSYRPDASSWGGDIGLVYEFRGRIDKFKFFKYNRQEDYTEAKLKRDKNKYSAKIGVSLLDVGVLKFKSAPLARNFNINTNNFNMWSLDIRNIRQFDTVLSQNVNYTGAAGQEYSVAMPTALSAQLDLHLLKGFYVNAMAYLPFNMLNKNTDFRIPTPQYYAVTPRWESRAAGVYVPFSMNSHKVISAGATVRLGPIFVGTSNLLTLIKKDNIQNADVHAGIKIPLAFGKPSKTANWLKKITNENDAENKNVELKENIEIKTPPAPVQPIQIIINNYNSPSSSTGNNSSNSKTYKVNTGENNQEVIIEENNIDTKELDDLQYQIEYLKNKLNQKEQLINELEKSNQQGGNSPESKKKIDSLRYVYLYDTLFTKKIKSDTVLSLSQQKKQTAGLLNELASIEKKDKALNDKIEVYKNSVDNQFTVSKNNSDTIRAKELAERKSQIVQLQALKPVYPGYLSPAQNKSADIKPGNKPEKTSSPSNISDNNAFKDNKKNNDLSNLVTKKDAEKLMTKKEYEVLKSELESLRNDVKNSRNANMAATVVSNTGRGFWRRRKDRTKVIIDTTYTSSALASVTPEVRIIRDTIYIDKPIEKIVERIVRDTITNTIEKNNIVTNVQEKTILKDNERELALSANPELVLFDVGSFMIKNIYFTRLIALANKIKKYPDLKISIKGHTDNTGSAEKNRQLSEHRADAVRVYMIKHGVKRENILVDALGSNDPFTENSSKIGKSQNRRVEVKVVE